MKSFSILCLVSCVLFSTGCEKNSTAIKNSPQILLSSTDESYLREIRLTISLVNVDLPQTLLITRNQDEFKSFQMYQKDTTVIDTGLKPSTDYTYQAFLLQNLQKTLSSSPLTLATMDTTSHEFNWETYTFGNISSSVLLNVFIVDENEIWAVGEIHVLDSIGTDIRYNAVHWDGQTWNLIKIIFEYYYGTLYSDARSVYAFHFNDIIVASGGSIMNWNGQSWHSFGHLFTSSNDTSLIKGPLNKLWGISSNDLFAVGSNGTIIYYDGMNWHKIESESKLALLDIWGKSDKEIYTVGLDYSEVKGVVLKYNGSRFENMIEGFVHGNGFDPSQLFKTQLYGTTDGVWVDERGTLYTVGNLMYQYSRSKWNYVTSLPENFIGGNPGNYYRGYLHSVRGNASNDIFIFGEGNTIIHFNGSSWKKIGPPYQPFSDQLWFNCSVKGDLVVGVGEIGNQAHLIRLWR